MRAEAETQGTTGGRPASLDAGAAAGNETGGSAQAASALSASRQGGCGVAYGWAANRQQAASRQWARCSEQVVAAVGQESGIVPIVRALAHFLLARPLSITQLRLGDRIEKTLVLVSSLLSANTQRNTGSHHPCTSRSRTCVRPGQTLTL